MGGVFLERPHFGVVMNRLHSRQSGFTLIELVVLMVLLAVLAVAALPRFDAAETTAGFQADRLARDIRHMQMLAITWSQPLKLTTAGSGYSVSCPAAGTTPPCNASPVIDPASGKAFQVSLENAVTVSGGPLEVDSLGRPRSGASLAAANTVFTLSGGSSSFSVTTAPISGFTQVN